MGQHGGFQFEAVPKKASVLNQVEFSPVCLRPLRFTCHTRRNQIASVPGHSGEFCGGSTAVSGI